MMNSGRYMVTRGVRDIFLDEDELRQQARGGLLRAQDLVFHPRLGRWLYARDVAEVEVELRRGAALGRPQPEGVMLVPVNQSALWGLILGTLGHVPILGLIPAGLGLYFSGRGLVKAQELHGSGGRLAVAGLLVSLLFLLPQLCAAALLWQFGAL